MVTYTNLSGVSRHFRSLDDADNWNYVQESVIFPNVRLITTCFERLIRYGASDIPACLPTLPPRLPPSFVRLLKFACSSFSAAGPMLASNHKAGTVQFRPWKEALTLGEEASFIASPLHWNVSAPEIVGTVAIFRNGPYHSLLSSNPAFEVNRNQWFVT